MFRASRIKTYVNIRINNTFVLASWPIGNYTSVALDSHTLSYRTRENQLHKHS